ncbi:MAG: OpgC domain-containing protein [Beijerinckiaceae bacterium]|nr:OpgC domain-containing protein [Beijerinckiaceae bacterium]
MPPAMMTPVRTPRDVRLDFFRGLAMFVIFIAHLPDNPWFGFIPARFGFSSAAELFVFCSGLASAFAFGRVFLRQGYGAGLFRVLSRLWQVYWAHIGLALVMMALSVAGWKLTGTDYPARLGLGWFYREPGDGLFSLMTLTFTPAFLDILPMYLVLLAMLPLVMLLGRLSPLLAMAALLVLWLIVQITHLNLPGGQGPGGMWFFNPFAWQLVFFTGFAFGLGWLKAPAFEKGVLFWACTAFLVASVPLNFWAIHEVFPALGELHERLIGVDGKTNLNPLLYLHFLASAYVVLTLIDPYRERLADFRPIIEVGQQALATFMASIALAWSLGMVLDVTGRDWLTTTAANLVGLAGLIAVARLAKRYKSAKDERAAKPTLQPAE